MNLINRADRGTIATCLQTELSLLFLNKHTRQRVTDLEKELSKMSVYSPGFLALSSPWIVSLWELQRVSGIKTCGEQRADTLFDIYNYSREMYFCVH